MLFLTNIPSGQKVALRNLLDSNNASLMNHILMKYISKEIRTEDETHKMELDIINLFFREKNSLCRYDEKIYQMFRLWSPQHFLSIYKRFSSVHFEYQVDCENNFWDLISSPFFSTISIADYLAANGVNIRHSIYISSIKNNHFEFFKWLESKVPIFDPANRINRGIILCTTMINRRIDFYRWILEKYSGRAGSVSGEYWEELKDKSKSYYQYIVDNHMTDFIQLYQQMNII